MTEDIQSREPSNYVPEVANRREEEVIDDHELIT